MGFQSTASTINLIAKLTAFGRQQLLSNSSNIITHFALGDSDAYYGASNPLDSGEVPALAGSLGTNGSSNSVAKGYAPKSLLYYNSIGQKKKLVKEGSTNVINDTKLLGQKVVSGSSITLNSVNRTDYETDPLVNLFYSFRLPITEADDTLFTTTPSAKGGYGDTAMSGLSQDNILVVGLDSIEYGEMLDGKSVKLELTDTTSTTFTMYGSFEKTLTSAKKLDAQYKDLSFNSAVMGGNIVFLFSDEIQRPNNDMSKSWSTGHFATKPYSKSNKSQFNMFSDSITSTVSDKIVGVAYLDKGFIVITDPTILSNFDTTHTNADLTTVSFDSISTQVSQTVTCIKDRGEFASSSNPTWDEGDKVRITEVLLLDNADNILAVAKSDRSLELTSSQFMALSVTISV